MKRIILIMVALVGSTLLASAQDLITTRTGEELKAKVLEVSPNEVKYKLFDDQDGATYIVPKTDLLTIQYESGRTEVFNSLIYNDFCYSKRIPVEGIVPNMRYKDLKKLYDYRLYVPDTFDRVRPAIAGFTSWLVPGMGECLYGELGRGLPKFISCVALTTVGAICIQNAYWWGDTYTQGAYAITGILCFAACFGIDIWSIVDAVRISKVKNMYEQDLRRAYPIDFRFYPSVNCVHTPYGVQPAPGVTVGVRF